MSIIDFLLDILGIVFIVFGLYLLVITVISYFNYQKLIKTTKGYEELYYDNFLLIKFIKKVLSCMQKIIS